MITALIIIAVVVDAVAGWYLNDLTKGRRLRRRFARHLDLVEQYLLSDVPAVTAPPTVPPPIGSLLGVPVITSPFVPPGTAFIVATDFLRDIGPDIAKKPPEKDEHQ